MDDLSRLIADPIGEADRDLAALGGVLVCFGCNDVRPLPGPDEIGRYLDAGWPQCCDETMYWVTAEQMGGASTSPISERALAAIAPWMSDNA